MNVTKLGYRLSSPVLAIALAVAPVGALAAPPDEGAGDVETEAAEDAATDEQPEDEDDEDAEDEGEDTEGEDPEGEEAEGEDPEGEEVEGEDTEGEEVEGEDTEGEEMAEDEGELEVDTGEDEEAEGEVEPPVLEGPLRPPEPTWGPKDQYPMTGKGMLITGGVVTGLGAAFIITSILITRCDFDSALSCKYGDQRDFLVPTAVAITGLGLLLVGVGVGNKIKYKRWQNWSPETAVVPTGMPGGGGGVAWVGKF